MKNISVVLFLFTLLFLPSCSAESRENQRLYTEGVIVSLNSTLTGTNVHLKSAGKNIAEQTLTADGRFILSGPAISEESSLFIGKKIKSFSASQSNCQISSDSLEIMIPHGITYVSFPKILTE